MTLPHHTDRRTVVKGTAALIGTPLLGGVAAADHDEGIAVEVLQQSINPDSEGIIPTRVELPSISVDDNGDFWFGHVEQFVVERGDNGEVLQVGLPEDAEEVLANPVRTRSVAGHEGHWIMHFHTQDVDFSAASGDQVTMGLVFDVPDVPFVPADHFATDAARLVPG